MAGNLKTKNTVLYKEKNRKMPIKSVKMKISKRKNIMSQGSLDPKNRFLCQKVCYVAHARTDRHTDRHESEYRGHPFRVSGFFPSTRIGPITNILHIRVTKCICTVSE